MHHITVYNYPIAYPACTQQVPDCGTINGIGRYVGGPSVTRARVNVIQGKRYRLRVVNISAYGSFTFSIENHPITIIEVSACLQNCLVISPNYDYCSRLTALAMSPRQLTDSRYSSDSDTPSWSTPTSLSGTTGFAHLWISSITVTMTIVSHRRSHPFLC